MRRSPKLGPALRDVKIARFAAMLALLIAGCGPGVGDASLGPDAGGGFYCPHNAFEGCARP